MICLRYGNTNTYFGNGLLIDTDMPGTMPKLCRELKGNGLSLRDVRFVLATHYHPDHVGLIGELIKGGTRLVLLAHQKPYVHAADPIFVRQKNIPYVPIREDDALVISPAESRAFLEALGISGEIIPTVSHSPDGIALITDVGDCFVGDVEPLSFLAGYEHNEPLQADWDALLCRGARHVFFGHANDVTLQ